jgi:hypothetical protein
MNLTPTVRQSNDRRHCRTRWLAHHQKSGTRYR